MSKTHRERTPFSANRTRLSVKLKEKGFVHRWFNDQDDRVQRALDAGYDFVTPDEIGRVGDKEVHGGNSDLNSKVSKVVGRTAESQPIRAFLLKIREEWFKEDQAKKEATNRLVDEAVRSGKAGGASVENQYGKVDLQR
jgi:hypothetical protein